MSEYHALSNAEAVVDDLARVLLDVCNCDRVLMQAISKLTLVTKLFFVNWKSGMDLLYMNILIRLVVANTQAYLTVCLFQGLHSLKMQGK